MAESISGSAKLTLAAQSTDTEECASQVGRISEGQSETYANGTSNGQIDTLFSDDGTLAATGSVDYDLDGGALTGPLGDAMTFADGQFVYVENDGAGDLRIYGDFLGLAAEYIPIPAGGWLFLELGTAGKAVVAGTGDVITLYSTAGTNYRIVVGGRSA